MGIGFKKKFPRYLKFAAVVFAILLLTLNRGFRNLVKRKFQQIKLEREISEIKRERTQIRKEIHLLENDESYRKHLIRKHLGYALPGEYEFRIRVSTK
ncbi:MAG: septum formation initiator family protein [Elusimicrobia bacterium]|nr:septum formation initiator family protein [Elusimicrobiota bacterium]